MHIAENANLDPRSKLLNRLLITSPRCKLKNMRLRITEINDG
jgi:hypothetical protein